MSKPGCRICGAPIYFRSLCAGCYELDRLESAQKKLGEIRSFLKSGKATDSLKSFETWKKRKTVTFNFRHFSTDAHDPLEDEMGTDIHILIFPKKMGSGDFLLVGKRPEGWWYRHGYIRVTENAEGKKTHEMQVSTTTHVFDSPAYTEDMRGALYRGVSKCLRPVL